MDGLGLVCFRQFLMLVGLGGCGQFWLILGGCRLLLVLASFGWLFEVVGYFD